MNEWIGLALVFVVSSGSALMILVRGLRLERLLEARLEGGDNPDRDPPLLLGPLTNALSAQIPMSATARQELQKDLRSAGFYRPTALMEYTALRSVLVLVPLFATGLVALLVPNGQIAIVLWFGLMLALLGFSVPLVYIYFRGKSPSRRMVLALPVRVDLVTM